MVTCESSKFLASVFFRSIQTQGFISIGREEFPVGKLWQHFGRPLMQAEFFT